MFFNLFISPVLYCNHFFYVNRSMAAIAGLFHSLCWFFQFEDSCFLVLRNFLILSFTFHYFILSFGVIIRCWTSWIYLFLTFIFSYFFLLFTISSLFFLLSGRVSQLYPFNSSVNLKFLPPHP